MNDVDEGRPVDGSPGTASWQAARPAVVQGCARAAGMLMESGYKCGVDDEVPGRVVLRVWPEREPQGSQEELPFCWTFVPARNEQLVEVHAGTEGGQARLLGVLSSTSLTAGEVLNRLAGWIPPALPGGRTAL